ncbi:MAG: helix-turn-helix domain-containing protein [Bacteroidota bacterium]
MRKLRMDLGLTQEEAAKQIGVSEDCLCYWEKGRNVPQLRHYPAIISFLDYYPFNHETETFGGKIKRYKYEHGLNNKEMARLLGADAGTISNWERNRSFPTKKRVKYFFSVIINTFQK